jgi:hypothetical protein
MTKRGQLKTVEEMAKNRNLCYFRFPGQWIPWRDLIPVLPKTGMYPRIGQEEGGVISQEFPEERCRDGRIMMLD